MDGTNQYLTNHPNPAVSDTRKPSQPAPVIRGLTTTTTNAVLPHPTIPGHSQPACEKCFRKFDLWGDLEMHRDAHRRGQVQYWCISQCGEGYTTGAGLQRHQASCQEITAARYFDATFTPTSMVGVSNHPTSAQVSGIHSGVHSTAAASGQHVTRPMVPGATPKGRTRVRHYPACDRCPRDFKTRPMLEEHLAGHERGTLVFCTTPGCGRGYPTAREVKTHQKAAGCGLPSGGTDPCLNIDTPELQRPSHGASRSNAARHSVRAGPSGTGNPATDAQVRAVFRNEGTRTLDEWQLEELERSYRKDAYPGEEEMQRFKRELWLSKDVVRRWFSTRRMQDR